MESRRIPESVLCSNRPVLRYGLAHLLKECLGADPTEASTREQLVHCLIERQPGLAVVDLSEGIDLRLMNELEESARSCVFVLVVRRLSPEVLHHITDSGRFSVVCETADLDQIRSTLAAAAQAQTVVDPNALPEGYTEERIPLSPREAQLVALLAQGMKNREIAEALDLSVGTVKVYLSHLFNKLHVKDRFELALYALRNMGSLSAHAGPGPWRAAEAEDEGASFQEWRGSSGRRMQTADRRRGVAR